MENGKGGYWLEAVDGPDRGRRFPLAEGETSIGRSSSCGIVLADPVLSRRHCIVEQHGETLSITDLDSANGTEVNGAAVRSAPLAVGDIVAIGETRLAVRAAGAADIPQSGGGVADDAPIIDLGLSSAGEAPPEHARPNWRPALWAVAAVAVLAAAASAILRGGGGEGEPAVAPPPEPQILPLTVSYEKIEADTNTIFRYSMALAASGELSVAIDDLAEDRHVRKRAAVAEDNLRRLARQLERAGAFLLESPDPGVPQAGMFARRAVAIVSGTRLANASVENRAAPAQFDAVCELLETFGKNELGIWAVQYPAERLLEFARERLTHAQNLYEQRAIAHGNVFNAIAAFREAMFYLETIEPKPDFYPDILTGLSEAEALLATRYEEQRFRADRAINLKDWRAAAEELRILREQIPDEDDPRNADATRKLLDVENRLKKARGK